MSNFSLGAEALPAIPPDIALITGPTMLGIMLNWGFMGVLAAQIYFYCLHFPDDRTSIKCLVYGLGLLDTLQTGLVTADAFHWFVYGFGNMDQLNDTFLNSWDVPFLDSIISLVVQSFYCWRIYVLRKRSLVFPIIILAVSLTQCTAGIVTAVIAHRLGKLSLISTEVAEQTIWLVGSVLADILITVVLTWTLLKSRSGDLPSSNSLLSRIARLTVETNFLTSGVAIFSLIIYLGFPQHPTLVVPPTAVIGKMYSNCLVAVLNSRQMQINSYRSSQSNKFTSASLSSACVPFSPSGGNVPWQPEFRTRFARQSDDTEAAARSQVKVQVLEEVHHDRDANYIELEDRV